MRGTPRSWPRARGPRAGGSSPTTPTPRNWLTAARRLSCRLLSMTFVPARFTEIRRSGPPTTTDGSEWTIPISGQPPDEWVRFFEREAGADSKATVRWMANVHVIQLGFKSVPDDVGQNVQAIDRCIALANDAYRNWLEAAHRKGEQRRRGEQTEADRVRDLNERFKDL